MRSDVNAIRVAILDDHPVVHVGVGNYLKNEPSIEVAACFERSRDLFDWLMHNQVDVVMLDYTLGPEEIDGLNLVKLMATRFPDCKVLMISSSDTPATVNMTMRAGALGFVGKGEDLKEFTHAVYVVASGKAYISSELSQKILSLDGPDASSPATPVFDDKCIKSSISESSANVGLSPREFEVLRHYLSGMTVADIASKLYRSGKTVSSQKRSAFRKLGIRCDAELFALRKYIEEN
ncbi:response regulator transcription factor [Burkholderia territorii]|uniref:response regulator n=1 Tax=Burkholderia territorii TaxID=1503055 RepID=UPI000752CEF6|nr:response regulator transcription factor [Burkholderia territorii]KVL47128.1 LuxR family transcriptional regulator [Burkholderia territorii]